MSNQPQSAQAASSLRKERWCLLLAAALLAVFWLQAVSAARHWSITSDELPHIAAGYVFDRYGDYRMHSENGNLPQRVHGLVPLALGARFPTNETFWKNSTYWQLAWEFFFAPELDNPTDKIVIGARALNALFGVALGAFIFAVAKRWYGPLGGLLSLAFFVFCPNFLAHSALATSDMAGALCLTIASWLFWRHLEKRDWRSGVIAGLGSGLALVAKFNGILLAPIYAGLIVIDAWGRAEPGVRLGRFARNISLALLQAVAGILIIWAFFSFRFSGRGAGTPELVKYAWDWTTMTQGLGWKAPVVEFARHWKLLPEPWLYGLANVLAGETARPAFLAGEFSLHGWHSFFPTVFLAKTSLGILAALVVVLSVFLFRRHENNARSILLRWAPLACPTAVVAFTAIASHLNIGHRHILAVYPALFVSVGSLATWPRRWLFFPFALLLVHVSESIAIRPHYMAFFNALSGGPAQAYRLVVDSSLDWGQDLPALRDWLMENRRPGEKVYLGYFGSAWPPHYGVKPDHFLPARYIARPPFAPYDLKPGIYCLSATALSGVYSDYHGPWRPEWQARLNASTPDSVVYDELRFARLCRYLQTRPPDATAGYSILIFRLKEQELNAALFSPVNGW